jgi:hypothetical protein
VNTHAGETAEEVQHVSRQLRASGIGSILAYSVESDVDAASATACQIEAAEVHTTALGAALPSCMCSNWCHVLGGVLVLVVLTRAVHVSFHSCAGHVNVTMAQVQRDMHLGKLVESVQAAQTDDSLGFAAVKVQRVLQRVSNAVSIAAGGSHMCPGPAVLCRAAASSCNLYWYHTQAWLWMLTNASHSRNALIPGDCSGPAPNAGGAIRCAVSRPAPV